ncbi:peritrophin-44 [Calliphora vicina]|uniref:peritrophin-44 n=1 Tax=Calliphora vicina TaxID=7373 RepID=UPI00325A7FB4
MKALQLMVVFVLSVALITIIAAQNSDYTKLCRLFKNNTKIRVPGSCHQYIVCNGDSGDIFSCANNLKYSAKDQKCMNDFTDSKRICENRCTGVKDGTWVADPTNCHGYYYCQNGKALASSCERQYYFEEKPTPMCVYPRYSTCIDVNNICELVADNTQFRNEMDCSQYYKCAKNILSPSTNCTKSFYFDVETQNCKERKYVKCNAHPINHVCLGKVGKKADGGSCRGYFLCAYMGTHAYDAQPVWLECPAGTFFSEEAKSCVDPTEVKCDHNRCDGRGKMLVNSSQNNCRNYIECENNKEVKEGTCGRSYFFDEHLQACVPNIIYFKCCDQPDTH